MTALVTGGAGFIGTNLIKRLLDAGYAVIAVDNFITSDGRNVKAIDNHRKYLFVKHDIAKPLPKKIQSKKIDAIFHLACPTGVPNLIPLAEEMLLTCSYGTRNILELAKKNNASVVFTSSSEVYGDPEVFPQKEEYSGNADPVGIRSPYEEGKRFSESIVAMYVRKFGVNAKIVRVFNTYGPYMSINDSRVIPNFIHKAIGGKPIPVQGDGKQKRTFCYVDDLVSGILLVEKKGTKGKVYNLGSDKELSIAALAKKILTITGSKSKITNTARPAHDHKRRMPDLGKVKKLGWKQTVDLDEGLKRTLAWYKIAV